MRETLKRIIKYSLKEKNLFLMTLFFSFCYAGFNLLTPLVTKQLFDILQKAIQSGNTSIPPELWFYVVLYVFVTLLFSGQIWLTNFSIEKWFAIMTGSLSKEGIRHIQNLSLSFFEGSQTGEIKEKMSKGIAAVIDIIYYLFMEILTEIVFAITATVVLLRINYIFGLILLGCIPLYIFITFRYHNRLTKLEDRRRETEEAITSHTIETISNIKTIKSFAAEQRQEKRLVKLVEKSINLLKSRIWKLNEQNFLRRGVVDLGSIAILSFAVYLVIKGEITFGTLYLVSAYSDKTLGPLRYLMRVYDSIQKDLVSAKRYFEILDTRPAVADKDGAKTLIRVRGKIEINRLKFNYHDKAVIKNISFTIPAGEKFALVGKSGVGKSTLVKLLLRFYDPTEGEILIDGINLKDVTQKSLRNNIGVVMQDSILFNETVMNNILFADENATKEQVIKAAKMANAHEFIMKLPKGYDTVVGEKGVRLSGGEQQRINIARVFLKNPPIIILDEATSSLDSESEKLIQDALWKLLEGKTAIIIAHRLSTVMRSDHIAVIEKGRIAEIDTHEELLKKEGTYQKLFKIQSGAYVENA